MYCVAYCDEMGRVNKFVNMSMNSIIYSNNIKLGVYKLLFNNVNYKMMFSYFSLLLGESNYIFDFNYYYDWLCLTRKLKV